MAFVFGYGSLMGDGSKRAHLRGFRRVWNVAMDNRVTIPGYKYYVDPDGSRPAVYVTFLNLVPGEGVDGVVVDADLDVLDARERNYARVDVSDAIDVPGPVYAYLGLAEAVASKRTIREVALEKGVDEATLDEALDLHAMARPHERQTA